MGEPETGNSVSAQFVGLDSILAFLEKTWSNSQGVLVIFNLSIYYIKESDASAVFVKVP